MTEKSVAQAIFDLNETQIVTQQDLNLSQPSGSFMGSLLLGSLDYQSTTGTGNFVSTTASPSLPLSVAHVKVLSIGTLILGGARPEIILNNQAQSIYAWLLNIGAGPLMLNFRLAIAGTAWHAGTYTSTNTLTYTTPATQALTINVPSFLTVNTTPDNVILTVTSLNNFRNGSLTGTHTFEHSTSLETDLKLKSTVSNFTFNTTLPKIVDPSPSANLATAMVTSPTGGSTIILGTTDGSLATTIPIQVSNKRNITTQFNVSAATLKTSFTQAGTYILPLTYTLSKAATTYGTALTATTVSSLQVVVPRLFEFIAPTGSILLNINSIAAYRNGITVPTGTFNLSSTVPYNVTVSASGDFSNGNGDIIPANTVTVESISSETGVTAVALSTTAQNLVTGASPVIDRNLNLQYRIPAARAANLLGKTAGVYLSNITYTCTAP